MEKQLKHDTMTGTVEKSGSGAAESNDVKNKMYFKTTLDD